MKILTVFLGVWFTIFGSSGQKGQEDIEEFTLYSSQGNCITERVKDLVRPLSKVNEIYSCAIDTLHVNADSIVYYKRIQYIIYKTNQTSSYVSLNLDPRDFYIAIEFINETTLLPIEKYVTRDTSLLPLLTRATSALPEKLPQPHPPS